ncbi:MAG TPA: hypothetical protein VH593_16210 [Ktedonobacteraceae bacterium]
MSTLPEQDLNSLFRIEEVVLPAATAPKVESGCDLCQHCFLLRSSLLNKSIDSGKRVDTCVTMKETAPCSNQ